MPEFRRLAAEGSAAAKAQDFKTAQTRFAAADARMANYPPLLLRWAQTAWAAGDAMRTHALMLRYASAGLIVRRPMQGLTIPIDTDPAFADVRARLDANTTPLGRAQTLFEAAPSPFLAESVARDEARGRWLISSVHRRTIMAVGADGKTRPWLDPQARLWGVFNLLADAKRGVLWASTSALPQIEGFEAKDKGSTALVKIDLASGKVLARYVPPPATERSFGDLAMGADGTVYVSDSGAGPIWRLRPGARALERVTADGDLISPQGIIPTPDGRRLIVADYPSGLQVVDLKTGAVSALPAPADGTLVWVDGMVRQGGSILAIQNSTDPQRVLRLDLDPGFTRIVRVTVLAQNLAPYGDLTGGLVVGRDFVFVGNSQWAGFGDDGKLDETKLKPALVARLRLR